MRHKKTTAEFLEQVRSVHGKYYDYSQCHYIGTHTKTIIICPIHGDFKQQPHLHLRGQGCPTCRESQDENGA